MATLRAPTSTSQVKAALIAGVLAFQAPALVAQSGTLDPTFSGDGIFTANLHPWFDELWAITMQDDGKIVGAGMIGDADDQSVLVIRLTNDGNLDSTWGGAGTVVLSGIADDQAANAIAVQSTGRVIVGGSAIDSLSGYDAMICGLTPTGELDTTFALGGVMVWDYGEGAGDQDALDLHVLTDDRILIIGTAVSGLISARLLPDGAIDASYGTNGAANTGLLDGQGVCSEVTASGEVLVGGALGYEWLIARLYTNGFLDTDFGSGGTVSFGFGAPGASESVLGISEMPDGRIVACGYSGHFGLDDIPHLAMLMPDGSFDTGFGNGGVQSMPYAAPDFGQFRDVAALPNGKFLVAGFQQGAYPFGVFTLFRFSGDGSLDASFAGGGQVSTDVGPLLELPFDMALDTAGAIVVAGWAVTSAHTDVAIVRYLNDLGTSIPYPAATDRVVHLYPNPANDMLFLHLPPTSHPGWSVRLYDAAGRSVHTENYGSAVGSVIRFPLPVQLPAGSYALHATDGTTTTRAVAVVVR